MQQEKNKANEDRKIAILEAKYEAEVKKAEEQAKKRLEQQKFKAEQAQARARDAAEKKEKRRYEAELKRKAKEETRKFIAEVKKSCAEKKRKEIAEKKLQEKKLAALRKEKQRQTPRDAQIEAQNTTHTPDPDVLDSHAALVQKAKKVNMFDEFRAPKKNN
jgi:membrane protein involved in colicin uptake